jgi:hypothetical protein
MTTQPFGFFLLDQAKLAGWVVFLIGESDAET